jgi:type IV pilus assembly protein PilN
MIRINLLSEGRRPVVARKSKPKLGLGGQDMSAFLLGGGLLLGLLVAGAWWWMLNGDINEIDAKISDAKAEVEKLRPIIKEVEDFKEKKLELDRKINVIKGLSQAQKGPVQIMDQISRALPDLLWLEQMTVTGNAVRLRGKAFNTNAVATFLENLGAVSEFREPVLEDLPADRGSSTYTFRINFTFTQPKPEEVEDASLADGDLPPEEEF